MNNTQLKNRINTRTGLLLQLKFLYDITQNITSAARHCASNYQMFQGDQRFTPVSFLDFDVIFGAIKPIFTAKILEEAVESNSSLITNLIGPYTIKNVLTNLNDYCLPLGSKIELIERKGRLREHVTEKGRILLNEFNKARESSDPITYITNRYHSKQIDEIILQELETISTNLESILFFDSILKRSIPVEELVGNDNRELSNVAYQKALSNLEMTRPHREINNINDSLNIATIVWILDNPGNYHQRTPLPFMISHTNKVLDLGQRLQEDLNLNYQIELFNNFHYMLITQLILNHCRGSFQRVVDQASYLAQMLENLAQSYYNLYSSIESESIEFDQKDEPAWCQVKLSYQSLYRDFDWLIKPIEKCYIHDRIEYLNTFSSGMITKLLNMVNVNNALEKEQVSDIIVKISDVLHESVKHTLGINDLLYLDAISAEISVTGKEKLLEAFRFSISSQDEDDGAPLHYIESINNLKINDQCIDMTENSRVRIFVHSKNFHHKGAILAVSLKNKEYGLETGIVWPHKLQTTTIFNEIQTFIKEFKIEDQASVRLRFYYQDSSLEEQNYTKKDFITFSISDLEAFDQLDYIEILLEEFAVFVDIQPIEDIEMQFGIVANIDAVKEMIVNLADLVTKSSYFMPSFVKANDCYHEILRYILDNVKSEPGIYDDKE